MAEKKKIYTPDAIVGGGSDCLDGISQATLNAFTKIPWAFIAASDGSGFHVFRWNSAGTDATDTSVYSHVRPLDYSGPGVWDMQQSPFGDFQLPVTAEVPIEGDIRGFNATISGNVITFTSGACKDSTGLIDLITNANKTVTIPSTVNLISNIYVVRKVSDSSIEFRSYSIAVDPSSDTAINAWRRISFAKNSAAGVTMPFKQTGARIDWLTSTNRPILTPTLGASYSSYNIDTVLGAGLYLFATILTPSQVIYASLDGTTDLVSGIYGSLSVTPSSIYLKYNSGTVAVHINSVTLRR